MTKHFQKDIARLSDRISNLGSMVVAACDRSIIMMQNYDLVIADEILESERIINEMEVEIQEECLKVLALHQPVASDLRFLILVLKVNNDLERMGDQVVNIAERLIFLVDQKRVVADLDILRMGEICSKMVHGVLQALVHGNVVAARKILAMDDDLDAMHAGSFKKLQKVMREDPDMIEPAISYLTISSNLERIGDLATNIAEEIIFMEEGEVIRHK